MERDPDFRAVPGKAAVCIGVRRCGKSTFMFQFMGRLLQNGVRRQNILYLNFFDDRIKGLQGNQLQLVLEAYFFLFPQKKNREKIYCFFDELQEVPDWEPFVDRLMRTEKCEVYITGSSAKMLSREIASQMRGRSLSWELFPFSFSEFLDAREIDHTAPLSAKKRLAVQNSFGTFWEVGGFPEVATLPGSTPKLVRIKILQEYYNTMLFRDLIERHNISHPRALTDLAHWLVDNIAALYSVNRLTGYLKSLGHKAPKPAVSDYLAWFEDAYILFSVRLFDASLSRSNANPKKIYCIDHGLVRAVSSGILINSGHFLENLVFTALRRLTQNIFYYRPQKGKEVDFIARMPDKSYHLIQVTESMADLKTRNREVTALSQAMAEMGIPSGTIVSRNESDTFTVEPGTIHVVPAWRFLLDLDQEISL